MTLQEVSASASMVTLTVVFGVAIGALFWWWSLALLQDGYQIGRGAWFGFVLFGFLLLTDRFEFLGIEDPVGVESLL